MIYINKRLISLFLVVLLCTKEFLVYGQLRYNDYYQGPTIKYIMHGNHQLPQTPIQYAGHQVLQQQQNFGPQVGPMIMPQRPMQMVPGVTPVLDFNQVLLGGTRGYPGMRVRVNSRGFQYASSIIGNLLNDEIKRARIPPISQCMREVSGCIQIYNIYVSRYRCPQRILLYPAPPNRIVISVQNLDIGITGNLGGQIIVLLPIRLNGIVQMNAHQVSITTELVIERSVTGSPFIRVASCNVQLGYVDAYLENAGIIGDIVNSQFRQRVSSQVRQMIPSKLCGQLPQIVNEKLNGKLTGLPQSLSLLQIKDTIIGMMSATPAHCSVPTCQGIKNIAINQEIVPLPTNNVPHTGQLKQSALVPSSATVSIPKPQYPQKTVHAALSRSVNNGVPQKLTIRSSETLMNGVPTNRRVYTVLDQQQQFIPAYHPRLTRDVNFNINSESLYQLVKKSKLFGAVTSIIANNPCAGCPGVNDVEDPLTQARKLIDYLDWNKVSNIDLTLQLLNTYATTNDFTIDINGEFSPGGQGTTPFGPFPLQFPYPVSNRMVDGLISDFTLNSLLYHAHRAGFFSVRIGPETPKVGNLLRTTCSDDEDELEDHGVETDEVSSFKMKMKGVRTHIIKNFFNNRKKRADDGGLEDLGICFGDILPAIREKYPNKLLAVNIRTTKAPAIILSAMNGGTVQGYLDADADIFIDGTTPPQRVGTISISAIVVATLSSSGDKVFGTLKINSLSLKDRDGSLGLPQDALDNLGNLGKELLEKAGNDILGKGLKVSIPSNTGLPIDISSPQIQIVEHGLYLAADFTINPVTIQSLAGMSGHSGSCMRYVF
ncbi:Lipid-binding serum glycoprotein, C-terminal domain and Lipid-binding serum glycoprotein, N-terminal domain and Bactericidal permeability-increasing protein, alpha/beta domain-containing protein [Strongyloides ratti]|uniref:Lipid-binding serum glycoprotein, C-terminal domain and Lipid-binding serum glycoprotein, N-terminal domain and Bactericidal permeability-increasing protein, alpha/beta domain-containing protein n=1 Tax=Strongyloides ratti TaxID=34506 RepID=A0A090LET1_STRRB|nr:Lipid-binding serum glycoprotein, C-terminal domain and Lipid-binding serum glycoprotein, N-terminal domain and Bactericidal permeability-increasing protein, alpha/beta domain-containing protein [Strongyloides ratti]CEF66653.1 Lipid-binding serum glycoprotein, C-terminal domain and Lipid-binding serum glycoprotein, N-terminal domain and Bactericidal permeability-increasing protein, alpha/beta domain-containing protein [Strongyloides ratti]